ncbi:hypothetical protein AB5N19_11197 [Seiridium cardinale]|uniref:Uncharacterized protein n=1 Tax=Seiridium cardinale TaxID=138064 RepID=A0ABR2XSU0_9PEZI
MGSSTPTVVQDIHRDEAMNLHEQFPLLRLPSELRRLVYTAYLPQGKVQLVFLDKRPLVALWEALDPFLPAHIEVQIIDHDTNPLGEELEGVEELIHGCLKNYPSEEPDIVGGGTDSEGSSASTDVKD